MLAGLGAATAACWGFVVRAGEHAHHGGAGMGAASLAAFAVMMTGMMAPSTTGRLLGLVSAIRRTDPSRSAVPAAALFLCGYLAVWIGFSAAAAVAGQAVRPGAALTAGAAVWGALLIAVGLYQFTPLKRACLGHCRAPAAGAPARGGALRSGVADGIFCLGSCWALMLLPLAAGARGLPAMVLVTGVVMVEKLAPGGARLASLAGALLLAAGTVALAAAS